MPDYAIMPDGYELPLTVWKTPVEPVAVVLALHGFNDYRNAFAATGEFLAAHGVQLVAYDQRGFGKTAQRGIWPGSERLAGDAATMSRLLCEKYPQLRQYLLGVSMGGAVVLNALHDADCASGIILVAPAVWGWQSMPWWQSSLLWSMAHIAPGLTLTGDGLDIRPSDNIEMLRALGRDPLVIKQTRVDTIYGLTDLMESAYQRGRNITGDSLLLYGENDEIIPPRPTCELIASLPEHSNGRRRTVLYPNGYHMLLRDLQAEVVYRDLLAWIENPDASLPSGMEISQPYARLQKLCGYGMVKTLEAAGD
ncbi:MAG TPA: alpha/beta hydrolase [Gammaproteobacteria bacterium]|nr:alpha/beta hydrolase [Gammaproteobacteria bacterium]